MSEPHDLAELLPVQRQNWYREQLVGGVNAFGAAEAACAPRFASAGDGAHACVAAPGCVRSLSWLSRLPRCGTGGLFKIGSKSMAWFFDRLHSSS